MRRSRGKTVGSEQPFDKLRTGRQRAAGSREMISDFGMRIADLELRD